MKRCETSKRTGGRENMRNESKGEKQIKERGRVKIRIIKEVDEDG